MAELEISEWCMERYQSRLERGNLCELFLDGTV